MNWANGESWAYGVTTVPERRYNYLPQTIESLKHAGFDHPILFVDGTGGNYTEFGLPVVNRYSRIRAFGNWLLALLELWIRNPKAERYAIFQDDFITYRGLRAYLDQCPLGVEEYWNLLTFPQNEDLNKDKEVGWYESNQRGRGAVALVFHNVVAYKILTSPRLIAKPKAQKNPHRSIDGILVESLSGELGIREKVHYPTLVYHTGDCSSIGNVQHEKPSSWLGEEFDALNLLRSKP